MYLPSEWKGEALAIKEEKMGPRVTQHTLDFKQEVPQLSGQISHFFHVAPEAAHTIALL